jgi:WD40 repeat protein
VERYNGSAHKGAAATSVTASPGGNTVFVTGYNRGATSQLDYATVAYDAATGAQLWAEDYSGPGNRNDIANSVAVSPAGSTVFVTGYSGGATSANDYATVAYDAATGAQLWVNRYNGPGNGNDDARSVVVSPSGGMVFVTGESTGAASGPGDYATVAYDAATGTQLWVSRYNGPGNGADYATSAAVSPAGGTVYVTGTSTGGTSDYDYATVAYDAATGAQLWVKRHNALPNSDDRASAVAVSPTGSAVFVTGTSLYGFSAQEYATVAYDAATGAQLWVKSYNRPGYDYANAVAVSPAGGTVFVTGDSPGATSANDYATVAYAAATGAQLWVKRYNGPGNGNDDATSVAVSPAGSTVFVTGQSPGATSADYATAAYDAATGAQLWVKRYNGPGNDDATAVAVSPAGGTVFVTGQSTATVSNFATIAYRG